MWCLNLAGRDFADLPIVTLHTVVVKARKLHALTKTSQPVEYY